MDDKPDASHQMDLDECPNTWEYARSDRALLVGGHWQQKLEQAWQKLNSTYGYERDVFPRDDAEAFCDDPVEAFLGYVENGCYPPPEIVTSLAQCFEIYFLLGGIIELEEAFFGRPKRGVGTRAARKYAELPYVVFDRLVQDPAQSGKSLDDVFAKFVKTAMHIPKYEKHASMDSGSFLRSYHRWKERKDRR